MEETPRIYRYRKHVRWGQFGFPILATAIILPLVYNCIQLTAYTDPAFKHIILGVCAGVLLLPLITCGVGWYLFYKLAGVEVSIQDKTVEYKSRTGLVTLPLEEVWCIKFPSVKYLGGWVKIVTTARTVRLTVAIEDIGDFLLELKESLDANGLSDRYDRGALFQFFKTATFSDQSWRRVYRVAWKFILITLVGCLLLAPIGVLTDVDRLAIFALFALAVLVPTLAYTGAEIALMRDFAKATNEESFYCPVPNIEYENRILRRAFWSAAVVYVAALNVVVGLSM